MSHPRSILLATAALTLTLSACGAPADDDEESSATDTSSASPTPTSTPSDVPSQSESEPAPEPEPAGPEITVTVAGDTVTPNAEEIDLAVGEPLLMTITSDRAGEFHVHSKPEQYVEFEAGTSTQELVIETPGVVEAEEHDSGAVVAVITVE